MEKYSGFSEEFIKELNSKYPSCEFSFKLVNLGVNISVFFVLSKSFVLERDNLWQNISEEIALKFQPKLESVFEKWNLYIIYITTNKTHKELKNKIENDKFSSRKIVEDNFSKKFNSTVAEELVIKHITNTDLKDILANTQDKIQEEYKPINNDLWKLIQNDISMFRNTDIQEQTVEQIIRLTDEN